MSPSICGRNLGVGTAYPWVQIHVLHVSKPWIPGILEDQTRTYDTCYLPCSSLLWWDTVSGNSDCDETELPSTALPSTCKHEPIVSNRVVKDVHIILTFQSAKSQ